MIVVTYLLRQSITLYKNLGGGLNKIWGGGLEPLSPIASAATAFVVSKLINISSKIFTIG